MRKVSYSLIFFFAPLVSVQAEICPLATSIEMPATTPTLPRFEFATDSEVVLDKKTGLKWARCQWGHEWNVGTSSCEQISNDDMTWKEALIIVKDDPVYFGEQGWRLPNIKELASIVEYKCFDPAINHEVFPGSKSGGFWSNTLIPGNGSVRVVQFGSGEVASVPNIESEEHYLRLVKDVELNP